MIRRQELSPCSEEEEEEEQVQDGCWSNAHHGAFASQLLVSAIDLILHEMICPGQQHC